MKKARQETGLDRESWSEVKLWRRQERERLIRQRVMMGGKKRRQLNELIEGRLVREMEKFTLGTFGFYWPFKGEYDARALVRYLLQQGWVAALPAVVERGRPLEFRVWTPEAKLVPGIWKIPVPADSQTVCPDVLLIPVVGFDDALYRLGYGGGYYDRTVAALDRRPFMIGTGYDNSELETIYPQDHDIPMDIIITESGVRTAENRAVNDLA